MLVPRPERVIVDEVAIRLPTVREPEMRALPCTERVDEGEDVPMPTDPVGRQTLVPSEVQLPVVAPPMTLPA
ncbi:MAG: hypothetical protein A2849_03385 [Candidatus Taylorbacteria bacterium RIFCSPHIGHO2_01_FULL_51_15]|uniref:Uncharacterized protein n=1 Tax=Candidatus Taylorbacteria bacterium RIFCSPHIGHO2_01_FULL_51_15 TaxID=1802304 RepID=A0A1G2MC18_9BACT|nr:MAG: hypothetical protein A2849_03385 [Candidatus Taylorbacteria bacterium RIFCSPHIGHO2_01_FULL_51_15]